MPMNENSTIFSTNYTLSLLMPVMLWGAMRFGYKLMSMIWTPVLLVSIHYFYRYIPVNRGYDIQLAITSSSYLVSSFVVIYMSMLATRQRAINIRSRRLALLDPVVHMPNLRALSRALSKSPRPRSVYCAFLNWRYSGITTGCCCGSSTNSSWPRGLTTLCCRGVCLYADRLRSGDSYGHRISPERIVALDERIKLFRFIWDGMPLQPQVGISYCYVRSPVNHLYLLLGELSIIANLSLSSHHPESLQQRGAMHLQRNLKEGRDDEPASAGAGRG